MLSCAVIAFIIISLSCDRATKLSTAFLIQPVNKLGYGIGASHFRAESQSISSTRAVAPTTLHIPGEPMESTAAAESRVENLKRAIRSFNSSDASELLSELALMRNNNTEQARVDAYLDNLLLSGPDRSLRWWNAASIRLLRSVPLLSRFSSQAQWLSLRKTLDMTTPPPNVEDEELDDVPSQRRRRRRALVSLLRRLANPIEDELGSRSVAFKGTPAIFFLEKKARKEMRSSYKEDLTLRRPQDLETPAYTVLAERPGAGYEIRRYQPFSVCSVSMNEPRPVDSDKTDETVSDPKTGGARAFGALAGYLFGKNQQEVAMKMTTPVFMDEVSNRKSMSFVLPSEYWAEQGLSSAPKPLQGSGVTLERDDGGDRAVIMFGGYATRKEVEKRKKALLSALEKDKDWVLIDDRKPSLAQYNDPFTPPWKRLNEVSDAVKPRT